MTKAPDSTSESTTLTSHFKMIFRGVFFLTIGSIVGLGVLVVTNPAESESLKGLQQIFMMMAQVGFGAICGLLGGKLPANT